MLPNTHKENRHVGSIYQAHQRSNHIPDRVTLGDDEAVEVAASAECVIEVACLRDRVCSDQSL